MIHCHCFIIQASHNGGPRLWTCVPLVHQGILLLQDTLAKQTKLKISKITFAIICCITTQFKHGALLSVPTKVHLLIFWSTITWISTNHTWEITQTLKAQTSQTTLKQPLWIFTFGTSRCSLLSAFNAIVRRRTAQHLKWVRVSSESYIKHNTDRTLVSHVVSRSRSRDSVHACRHMYHVDFSSLWDLPVLYNCTGIQWKFTQTHTHSLEQMCIREVIDTPLLHDSKSGQRHFFFLNS